jgi:membrane protein implicated in regulation of membrane protease activity
MSKTRTVGELAISALVWAWAASLIVAMFAVYIASWQWTVAIVAYMLVSLAIVGFVAGYVQLNGHTPPRTNGNSCGFGEHDA